MRRAAHKASKAYPHCERPDRYVCRNLEGFISSATKLRTRKELNFDYPRTRTLAAKRLRLRTTRVRMVGVRTARVRIARARTARIRTVRVVACGWRG